MKKLITLTLLFSMALTVAGKINIIPQPVELIQSEGSFTISAAPVVSYSSNDLKDMALLVATTIKTATNFDVKTVSGVTGNIQLQILNKSNTTIGNEGYMLNVTPKLITISANTPSGVFYGIQSLLQLFPKEIESAAAVKTNWTVPCVNITDYPRFGWRGLMLDVSRHFMVKEDLLKYIDQMAKYKFNTLHLHLTDDNGWRIEIKSLPKLTEIGAWRVERSGRFGDRENPKPGEAATYGGFYTHNDIREIVAYAQSKQITIVPEIDVPGHSMAAIAAYPLLNCTKDTSIKVNPGTNFADWFDGGKFKMHIDNTLNPSDEYVYDFLDKVFTEVAMLFPSEYIHVGGDECYTGFWENDPGCQKLAKELGLGHTHELQGYFMQRVEKILKSKNKKLIGWDEILEGTLSQEAVAMNWREMKHATEGAKRGHKIVMTPHSHVYLDFCQGDPSIDPPIYSNLRAKTCYSFNPVPEGVDPKLILGGQGNLWTEHVPSLRYAFYMTYPRAWALSEVYWTPNELKNWNNFVTRVEAHFERADVANIRYSRAMYDAIIKVQAKNDKIYISMDSEVPDLEIYYTTDETMPDNFSPKYINEFELPAGQVTLRVITYRQAKPVGHLITLRPDELKKRAGR